MRGLFEGFEFEAQGFPKGIPLQADDVASRMR